MDNTYLQFNSEKKSEMNLVLTPKRAISRFSEIAGQLKEILRQTCLAKDMTIIAGKMTANYLHLLVAYPEAMSAKEVVEHIKKDSSDKVLKSLPELAGESDESFWAPEYMAMMSDGRLSDIFLNETIDRYILRVEQAKGLVGEILKNNEKRESAKCLVTGGAGFIGSNLVDELIRRKYEVVVIDSLATGKIEYVNAQAKFYKVDINSEKIADIFAREKFDFVFHLAAQIDVRKSVENPIEDNRINVIGGLNILENCHKHKVKKIIFISTGGAIYGDTEKIPTLEDHAEMPLSPYGIHKLTFEKYLNYYHKVYGMNYLTLRLANVYGPRQFKGGEAGVISIFVDNAVVGKKSLVYGDGSKTRDFVYVGDVVEAAIAGLKTDYVGWINIGTGQETSILEVTDAIGEALGKPMVKEHLEDRAGEQKRSCLDIKKADEILNWQPKVFLKEGIKRTIDWADKAANGENM